MKNTLNLFQQLNNEQSLEQEQAEEILRWASQLLDSGLAIAHSQYHIHGAYIVENSDLFGFSRDEQKWLSILVRLHRKKLNNELMKAIPESQRDFYYQLLLVLRLSVLLNRSHLDEGLPALQLTISNTIMTLVCPKDWLEQHPLIKTDLEKEASYLKPIGYQLLFQ